AERVRELRVGDGLRERLTTVRGRREREVDGEDDPAATALERARAIPEAEKRRRDRLDLAGLVVEEVDRHEARRELLPVGANVLHGSGTGRSGDPGERLDACPAVRDR